MAEAQFPYDADDPSGVPCNPPHTHVATINDWEFVGSAAGVPSVQAIKQAIYQGGPAPAAICAKAALQGYSGGVFDTNESCAPYAVNHAVLLVGWDDSQGPNGVWIMRNSWSAAWGEG